MDTLQAISSRRSIRKFKDAPVEWYLIGKVLWAGTHAPTAGNLQDFRFMVVTNPDLKKGLAEAALEQHWISQAPLIIVVFAEFIKTKRFYGVRGERLYTIQDCAAAIQNMLLAAHDLGLGTCWVGAFDEDKVNAVLGIPDYARPQALIPIGWPDEAPPEPAKYKMENFIFLNRWADNSGKVWDIPSEILKDWAPKVQGTIEGASKAFRRANETLGDKLARGAKKLQSKVTKKKGDRQK